MKLSDYFDKIFIIGALNSPKVEHTIETFKKLGLYDENVLVHMYNPLKNIKVKVDIPNDMNWREPDRISLALSHYTIIKQAYDAGLNNILLMEDDNYFLNDIDSWKKVLTNIPKDYDIIKFTGFKFSFLPTSESQEKPLSMPIHLIYNDVFRKIDFDTDVDEYWVCSMSAIGLNRKSMNVILHNQSNYFNMTDNGNVFKGIKNGDEYIEKCNIYMPTIPLFIPIDDVKKYNCGYYVKFDESKYI